MRITPASVFTLLSATALFALAGCSGDASPPEDGTASPLHAGGAPASSGAGETAATAQPAPTTPPTTTAAAPTGAAPAGPAAASPSAPPPASAQAGCDPEASGGRWIDTPLGAESGSFTVGFRAYPRVDGTSRPTLDGVIGLSAGPAADAQDLGPTVRFTANGTIEARNGDTYASAEAIPYRAADGAYEFVFSVDLAAHTYSVWVRHADQVEKPFVRLATDFAFPSPQSGASRLASIARHVDGAGAGITTCGVAVGIAVP